jgi:hypothetical protein
MRQADRAGPSESVSIISGVRTCLEILSKNEWPSTVQECIDDHVAWGVADVWVGRSHNESRLDLSPERPSFGTHTLSRGLCNPVPHFRYHEPFLLLGLAALASRSSGFMQSLRTRTPRYLAVVVTITELSLLSSCVTQRVQTVVPAFSQAVSTMTSNTKAAFAVVEQKYEEAQAFTLAVNYRPGERFDPASIRVLLPEEDLDARMKLLAGLEGYGSQLEAIAGGAKQREQHGCAIGLFSPGLGRDCSH